MATNEVAKELDRLVRLQLANRSANKISLTELSKATGYEPIQLWAWEMNGYNTASLLQLKRVAQALNKLIEERSNGCNN